MRKNIGLLLLIATVMAGCLLLACEDDESDVGGLAGDDDDDNDDNGNDGSLGTNECGAYGSSNCTDSDARACDSADLANEERYDHPEESACAPNLMWSEQLAAVALAHSKDMCDRDFFDHDNPDGKGTTQRFDDAGINWVAAGENIAMGTNMTAEQANGLWMDEPICEPNHRSNILSWLFTHIGVGVYDCGSNVYITQDFGTFSFSDLPQEEHPYCGPGF